MIYRFACALCGKPCRAVRSKSRPSPKFCSKSCASKSPEGKARSATGRAARLALYGPSRQTDAEYGIWRGIKRRCSDPNRVSYQNYGGRGITMCDRWRNSYEAFVEDVGRRPSPEHQLDRIDNNGHYEPGNVRWVDLKTQVNNRRCTRFVTVDGVRMPLARAAERLGITLDAAGNRWRAGVRQFSTKGTI